VTTGHAAFDVAGWLRLTAPFLYDRRGGTYLTSPLPFTAPFTVSFDMDADGTANGTCLVLFTDTSEFTTFVNSPWNGGGDSLGCIGMAGVVGFVGIEEYVGESIRVGPTNSTGVGTEALGGVRFYSQSNADGTLTNTTNEVRITVVVQPWGGYAAIQVWAQVGTGASPTLRMERYVTPGTTPTNGVYVGITGAVGGASGEHKVRNITVVGY
jgi:hypothetical protein